MKEVDYLTKKNYTFDDDLFDKQESITKIGNVFVNENKGEYGAPIKVFRT